MRYPVPQPLLPGNVHSLATSRNLIYQSIADRKQSLAAIAAAQKRFGEKNTWFQYAGARILPEDLGYAHEVTHLPVAC